MFSLSKTIFYVYKWNYNLYLCRSCEKVGGAQLTAIQKYTTSTSIQLQKKKDNHHLRPKNHPVLNWSRKSSSLCSMFVQCTYLGGTITFSCGPVWVFGCTTPWSMELENANKSNWFWLSHLLEALENYQTYNSLQRGWKILY